MIHSYIAGRWCKGTDVIANINPYRPESPLPGASLASKRDVETAIESAKEAQERWAAVPAPQRGDLLYKVSEILRAQLEPIARDLTLEEGKTLAEAKAEVRRAADILRFFGAQGHEPDGATYGSSDEGNLLYSKREPLGVVAAITPWNFPAAIPVWKIAPALVYGNTVVWKPSELVPLTSAHIIEAFVEAGLPQGTVNMVLGKGHDTGATLVNSPDLAGISFTGSSGVGNTIRRAAAETGARLQLEMGGSNPAVVLADANLEAAVKSVGEAAFLSAGQKCTATRRVVVETSIGAQFTRLLTQMAEDLAIGDPLEATTEIGPLASETQWKKVRSQLNEVKKAGRATTTRLAEEFHPGFFVPPTVVDDFDASSSVACEEVFGPVVTVTYADTYEEAVTIANNTQFGLSASIYTSDLGRSLQFADDSNSGVVKVNQGTAGLELHVPFGGRRASGYGPGEQGKAAAEFYTEWKTVYVEAIAPASQIGTRNGSE